MTGAKRGRKPIEQTKLEPLDEIPSPEGWGLCERGEEYWRSLAPQLIKLNILTELHLSAFAEMCRYYGEYRRLDDWLKENPERMTTTTQKGYVLESPQVRMRNRAFTYLTQLWSKFGLSPHSLAQMRKHGGIAAKKRGGVEDFAKRKYGDDSGEAV